MAGFDGGSCAFQVPVSEDFPYLVDRRGKKPLRVTTDGMCDPSMPNVRERLSVMRETMVAFRLTVAALNADIIGAAQDLTAFSRGVGDDGAALGLTGVLTRAETNTQQGGGLVQQEQSFVALGVYIQPVRPWCVAAGASLLGTVDAVAPRNYRPFLRSPVSPYEPVILDAVAEAASFQVRNGPSTACQFDIGAFSILTNPSNRSDNKGGAGVPGMFWSLATEDVSGGTTSGKELSAQLRLERALIIGNDVANPTPVALDIAVPFRVIWIGYPVCNVAPGAGGYSRDEVEAIARKAAEQGAANAMQQMADAAKQSGGLRR